MNFIELKSISGTKVLVNINLVTTIEPMGDRVDDGCAVYFMSEGDNIKVSNTYDEVTRLIFGIV